MASPASIKKHPIHPMLIVFPIGLWVFSIVSQILGQGSRRRFPWRITARHTLAGGIVGATLAAVPGFIDYLSLKQPKVKKTATWHLILNVTALGLFTAAWARMGHGHCCRRHSGGAFLLSLLGLAVLTVSGWLGGDLVYVHRVAVEPPPEGKPG